MKSWSAELPYFSAAEISCRCCGTIKIDMRMAAMLPALRLSWGSALTLNSFCRCPKHNVRVSGHVTSLHLTQNPKWDTSGSAAVDVNWKEWPTDQKLLFARTAHVNGFRVGLHNSFCHIDIGRLLGLNPRPFVYGQWDNAFSQDEVL